MKRLTLGFLLASTVLASPRVTTLKTPDGGIQPQVSVRDGVLHLVYFTGAPEKGDLFYRRSKDYGQTFSPAIKVNTREHAIAVGNIRGAQLAIGRNGRPHVAWNGVVADGPMQMVYARLNDAGSAFEPERNLMGKAQGIDGGGAVAADGRGDVFVLWHAPLPGTKGEENRRVWIARSIDDGNTFESERLAFDSNIGACGCCGMKAWAADDGTVYAMFRSAAQIVNRDIWLLTSKDQGKSFTGSNVSHWNIGACVMSSQSLTPGPNGVLAAWETEKQAWFGLVEPGTGKVTRQMSAPGTPGNRKHPVAIANANGETLFAWTDGMAWKKAGSIAWVVYDAAGKMLAPPASGPEAPVWSLIAAFAKPDGGFVVLY